MRALLSLALFLASAAASAGVTLLPGSSPQDAPAGVPFPNQISVLVTDANGAPVVGGKVGFTVPWYDGPAMDAPYEAFECFPDLGWNCSAVTNSQGVAILPGFWGPSPHEFLVYVGSTTLRLNARPSGTTFKSLQDMWWAGSTQNGWGMSVVEHGAQLFNVIYAYDADGKPTWWVMPVGTWSDGFRSSFAGEVYSPRSAPYFSYDASRLMPGAPAGRASLTFDGPDAATLSASIGSANVTKSLVRMPISPDVPQDSKRVGDMWWGGESQNGWGVAIIERDSALFCVWLTYGADGKPTWLVMPGGTWVDTSHYSGPLIRTTGSRWLDAGYDASALKIAASGSYTLHFVDARHATLDYSLDGHSGTLSLTRQPF